MSNVDGSLSLDPAGAIARLLERVEHIDRVVSRLERIADEAPPALATAVDVLDDASRRVGADLDQRLGRALTLVERLTEDKTYHAIETLLSRAEDLQRLAGLLDQAPGLIAMAADLFDEWAKAQADRGIDVETGLKQGLHAALWLGSRVSEVELERLGIFLRSDVLDPHALAVVGKTGRALATCHSEACEAATPPMVGPVAALKALNDPDIQRSLGFLLRVAKCFGTSVAEPVEPSSNPA